MIKFVKIIEKKNWETFSIFYDDDDADGRQMIAIAHWDLRPRRAKTKLIVKIYMKKVEI
jgi:hypothetical protein